MIRMLIPALVLAGPVAAHNGTHIHAHRTDYVALGVGLAVIALVATVLVSKLPK